jgi:hypothetical protein
MADDIVKRIGQMGGQRPGGFSISRWITVPLGLILIYVLLFRILDVDSAFGYFNYSVGSEQVGIRFNANRPYEVVGPGVYTRFGLFETMKTVKVEALDFTSSDAEVLTKDRQRIGVAVRGAVLRPGQKDPSILLQNWSTYAPFYTNDALLIGTHDKDGREIPGLIQSLSQQAVKVCVGDLDFDKAAVGSARDVLRECIDKELDKLAVGYGLEVRNIVVPNIVLAKTVQDTLDAITNSRLATVLAEQQKSQAEAEAKRTLATEQGKIAVEQGRIQEKAKQDATTADLEQKSQAAQYAVIEATKKNELYTANQNLTIAAVTRQVAEEKAKADIAPKVAEAAIYQNNPRYAEVVNTQAIASAYKSTDKVIVPAGTNPLMVMGSSNQNPQVNVQASVQPTVQAATQPASRP